MSDKRDFKKYNLDKYLKKWTNHVRAINILGGKCSKCDENHIATLSFHHVDPKNKEYNVARMLNSNYSWEEIEPEINKCILLCENCHRKFHFNSEKYNKYLLIIKENIDSNKFIKHKYKRWNTNDTEKLIPLYNNNLSIDEISHILNKNPTCIRKHIHDLTKSGLIFKRKRVSPKRKLIINNELKQQINYWRNIDKLTAFEISKKTGILIRRIYTILREIKNG